MPQGPRSPVRQTRIALSAPDHQKPNLLVWARYARGTLSRPEPFGRGTTGGMLTRELDLEACNRATTGFLLSSRLTGEEYVGRKYDSIDVTGAP